MMHILDAIKTYDQFDFDTFKLSSKWAVFKRNIQPFVNDIIEIMTTNENTNKISDINSIFENVKKYLTDTISTFTPEDIAEINAKAKAKTKVAEDKAEAKIIATQKVADDKAEAKITKAANKAEALKKEAEEKERKKNNKKQVNNAAATPQKKKKK